VRLKGKVYLFDAGEGVQLGWKRAGLGFKGPRVIAVSHLHADHCLGIPGLMMLRSQTDDPEPLTIAGPPGIEDFVRHIQRILDFYINYPVYFIEWSEQAPEIAYQDELIRLYWRPVKHTRFCLGYRLEELERPGRFDTARAESLGIPQGPLWGRLQRGETVVNEAGRTIFPGQVLGRPRRGRHVAFVVDTRPAKNIYRLCKDADIAFMEGMYLPEHAEQAEAKCHMTVAEAARIAGRAGVQRAVLTHISPRYNDDDLGSLETAARQRFDNVRIGRDQDVYVIPAVE
jgi:ribonuclease Z